MKDESTIPNRTYCVSGKAGATVTATQDGETYTLLTLSEDGQGTFIAIGESVTISDDTALLRALPKSAPALCGGAGASSPTHTKSLTSGSTATLRNGQIYTLKQSEMPLTLPAGASCTIALSGPFSDDMTLTVGSHTISLGAKSPEDIAAELGAFEGVTATVDGSTIELTVAEASVVATNTDRVTISGSALVQVADLSGLAIGNAVTTAEIWIECDGATAPDVALPTAWVWPNESDTTQQPELTAGKKHMFVVRNDGDVVIANLAQVY